MKRILFAVVASASCASVHPTAQSSAACLELRDQPIAKLDSSQLALLTGRFRMTEVNTSDAARGKVYTSVTALELRRPSSAERAQINRRTASANDVRLIGSNKFPKDDQPEYVEVHSAFIVFGCADCYDGRSTLLQIQRLDSTGFQGTWRVGQSGNFRMLQTSEMPAVEPGGRICAERAAADGKR